MSNTSTDFTETQYKAIPGQISTNESQGIVECFVAGIGNKDSVGDICLPGCFNGSLKRRKPRVVWGHNWNEPIGKVLEIYEVGPNDPRLPAKMKANGIGGLFAKVQFNLKSERGREAFSNVQFFGEEQEWSIGYKTLDAVYDNGKQANMLKEVELYEVSPVLHGANQLTGTISIKSDKPLKDPKGGLTAAGRAHFRRTEGANLKPGVKGPADTPTKMRRKGSFLTRFFTNPSGPMRDEKGRPTRLALSAAAWGEPVPKNAADAARLAAKGRRLLERYENSKQKSDDIYQEEKNVSIYAIANPQENPIMGRMGSLAKALASHFGGEVAVREADSNVVVFDMMKDGTKETMRASYHTPDGSEFMFGAAQPVKVETIYLPIDSNGVTSGAPIPQSPNMLVAPKQDDCGCGCGGEGKCGIKSSPFASWSDYKSETPGIHLYVKTENMEMFEVVNVVADYHGFDVELLSDGFVVPNIDWYEKGVQEAVISAVDAVEQKAFARAARAPLSAGRRMRRAIKPSKFDGDGDGFRTGPDGRDNIPYRDVPSMMPPRREPTEAPERERRPGVIPQPIRVPKPQTVPSRPAPVKPTVPSTPQRTPATSRGVSGAMRASSPSSLLEQLRNFEKDPSTMSGVPRRAMEQAIEIIAEQNRMSAAAVRRRIRRALAAERRARVLREASRGGLKGASVHVSISDNSDILVKSAFSGLSTELKHLTIEIEPDFVSEVKQALAPVAEYHGIKLSFATNEIKVFNSTSLTGEAAEALANAMHSALIELPIENTEFARIFGSSN